jgi:hypothetical protein
MGFQPMWLRLKCSEQVEKGKGREQYIIGSFDLLQFSTYCNELNSVVCYLALGVDFWMRMSKKGSGKSEYCGHIPPYIRLCYRTLPWESGVRRYRDHDHWYNLRLDALAAYQAGE